MSKKILGILCITVVLLSGCQKNTIEKEPPAKQEETDKNENKDNADKEQEQKSLIKIYYVNFDNEEIVSKEIKATGDISESIVLELKKQELLQEQCMVQKVDVNESEKTITIDINSAFGDYIRSVGTTGEGQIVECVTRTYLEAYDCEKIKITENGGVLETGHAIMDDYISYQ